MTDTQEATTSEPEGSDLGDVAEAFSSQASRFLQTTTTVASGATPEAAIPVLLLALSDLLAAGARLGAMVDVVPPARFEADAGPDTDLDPLRTALARILDGLDAYPEVIDPVLSRELGEASLSGDLAGIASALTQGLAHFDQGRPLEALWWWQFSYLSSWGERAAGALRVLQLILTHLRMDVDDDVAADAQFDALQAGPEA